MKLIQSIEAMRAWRQDKQGSVGFVPTLGALHAGHQALMARCREENESKVLSIFLNPTQFNQAQDLEHYPQTLEHDLAMAKDQGFDVVFAPCFEDMYPDHYHYQIHETHFSQCLEGQKRPGHFNGVLTVVMKLLQIVKPNRAYFGEKDYQQYTLIKEMVRAFFIDCDIIPCQTVRDEMGLPLSSRHAHLNAEELQLAQKFSALFCESQSLSQARERLTQAKAHIEYLEEIGSRRYLAISLGSIRLIDNIEV